MTVRTPVTLITGPLGSGKTTLLRHILNAVPKKIAILMNEFGEIAIDSKVIAGKNIRMAELAGGCVCCSLVGEFEAAVEEILEKVRPEIIIVETTGVAEPDALIFNIQEGLSGVRLDGVITVADADAMIRYPRLGHTTRLQIEGADLILLNKADLVSAGELASAKEKLGQINGHAPVVETRRCAVDPDLLCGLGREREIAPPAHAHQPEFESFDYATDSIFDRNCLEHLLDGLSDTVYRAKGFVRLGDGSYLLNFVAGRWELERFPQERTMLVFIGQRGKFHKERILAELKKCEQ